MLPRVRAALAKQLKPIVSTQRSHAPEGGASPLRMIPGGKGDDAADSEDPEPLPDDPASTAKARKLGGAFSQFFGLFQNKTEALGGLVGIKSYRRESGGRKKGPRGKKGALIDTEV